MNNFNNLNNPYPAAFNPLPNIQFNGYDPKGMFNNHNFINRNDIMHNNLNNILLNEEIREYSVMIDSKDRNYQIYPDPFTYDVRFNPLAKTKEIINGKIVICEDPNPIINGKFTNVRYIKLETVILPFFTSIRNNTITDENGDIVDKLQINTYKPLTDNLYFVLFISGYSDTNYRSTNDVLSESFATIYYDTRINNTHFLGYTSNGIKIFQRDQLGKIDRFKISFMDPYGYPLTCKHVDKKIKSNLICTCKDPEGDDDTDCFKHNLFHPLNPIFQHHLHFKIGVIEPRLNKKIFD